MKNDIQSNHSMIVGFLLNSIENARSKVAMSTYESEAPGIAGMTTPSQAPAGS